MVRVLGWMGLFILFLVLIEIVVFVFGVVVGMFVVRNFVVYVVGVVFVNVVL